MYGHYFPDARVDGVEIDGELTEIGRRYFDLGGPNLHTYTDDARPWLRRSDGDYDVIVVDAYRQPYIPFYLATREFFELARDRLAPGGVVVVNVGHPEGNDDLEKAISATMADVFATVLRDPLEHSNTLLLGSDAPASQEQLLAAIAMLPDDLKNLAAIESQRIGPMLSGGPGLQRRPGAGRVADRQVDPRLRGGPVASRARRRRRRLRAFAAGCRRPRRGRRVGGGPETTLGEPRDRRLRPVLQRRPPGRRTARHRDGGRAGQATATGSSGSASTSPARTSSTGSGTPSACTSWRSRTPTASISARSSRTTRAPTSSSSRPRTTTTSARRSTSARSTCSSAAAT